MTRANLISLVRAKMDEVSPFASNELVDETFTGLFLDNSAKEILLKAPLRVLTPLELSTTGAVSLADGTGYVLVPSDYLRLHSFKMTEWKEVVQKTITPQDPKYNLQKHTTTRGKPNKPVVVDMITKKAGLQVRVLKYFSVVSAYTFDYIYYIRDIGAFTTIDDVIADVTAYQAAGNIFLSQGRADQAQAMYVKVDEWIKLNQ